MKNLRFDRIVPQVLLSGIKLCGKSRLAGGADIASGAQPRTGPAGAAFRRPDIADPQFLAFAEESELVFADFTADADAAPAEDAARRHC